MGGVNGYQGFAGNMANKPTIGNSGMTRQQIKQWGQAASAEYQQQAKLEKQQERVNTCRLWGINPSQVDINRDGEISQKEMEAAMRNISQNPMYAQYLYGQQGTQGASGFSNPLELLNSPEAQNLLGMTGVNDTPVGNALGGVLDAFKGLFS